MGAPSARSGPRSEIEAQLISLVARYGYPGLRLEEVLSAAGIERAEFERHFEDLGQCFRATWSRIDEERRELTSAALSQDGDWRSSLRAALAAGLHFLAEDEERARFYVLEAVSGPESNAGPKEEAIKRIRETIAAGDPRSEHSQLVKDVVADGIAGGVWLRIVTLIGEGRTAELPRQLPQLMYSIVLPYYGRAAAEEELAGH